MKKHTAMREWFWTAVLVGVGSTSAAFGELQLEVNPPAPSTQTLVTVTVSDVFGSTCFYVCDVNGYWVGPTEYHIDWYIRERVATCSTVMTPRSSEVDMGILDPGDYLVTATEYVTLPDDPCESAVLTAETDTTFHVTEAPPIPCPVEGVGNCQMCSAEDSFVLLSDLTVPPAGAVHADDFMPETDRIDTLCVWGTYLDAWGQQLNHSCSGAVEDNFRVRVYSDNNGLPGYLIAERWVIDPVRSYVPDCPGWNATYGENLPLELFTMSFPTITLSAGVTHWLEVANKTDVPAGGWEPVSNTCYWHWMQVVQGTTEGNRVNATGTDDRCSGGYNDGEGCKTDSDCSGPGVCKPGYGGGYIDGSERWSGTMFCLGYDGSAVNFTPGEVVTGACCDCEGFCDEDVTQAECADFTPGSERIWTRDALCTTPEVCDPPPGDICSAGPIPIAGPVPIKDGLYAVDTSCATSDFLPSPNPEYEGLAYDVWYSYTTTCTGILDISMCASSISWGGYDSYLAVYHDWDNPTECPCPGDPKAFLVGGGGETCNCIDDGGAGTYGAQIVFAGECYLIGIGGWQDLQTTPERGRGFLDVACQSTAHPVPPPAEPATLFDPKETVIDTKNRFLSIIPPDDPRLLAIRVKAVSLPPPFDAWTGQKWYAGEPIQVCENSGQGSNVPPSSGLCGPAPGQPQDWFWAAPLVCNEADVHYMQWTDLSNYCNAPGDARNAHPCWEEPGCGTGTCGVSPVLHLYHEGVVPSHMSTSTGPIDDPAVYDIQLIEYWSQLSCGYCYSDPLTMTQAGWGDVVTDVAQCPNGPPNGNIGVITDVIALLNKFQNRSCAPKKTRGDLYSYEVDFKIDITDVVHCLGAFVGGDYPFGAGNCWCVDPSCSIKQCSGGPDHGTLCEADEDCSSEPCGLDP